MKLAPILAQYLYANKRLDLPGIGSFLLDADGSQDSSSAESIHFKNNPATRESADLVAYISAQTGKMKALAAADLSSHLELAQQFLNIGKPFLLEGIGSLSKIRSGEYAFSGADISADKLKDHAAKEAVATSATEESFSSYEPLLTKKTTKFDWKKPALIALTLAGTGLAIWGGYTVYKRSAFNKEIAGEQNNIPDNTTPSLTTTLVTDSSAYTRKDSVVTPAPVIPAGGKYKFVLETAGKTRALDRYSRLKTYQWNVQMETKDSVQFKLFMLLPAIAADTTRIIDSLTALNGRRVTIEN